MTVGLTLLPAGVNVDHVVPGSQAGYKLDAWRESLDERAVETMEAVPMPQEAHCTFVLSTWMHSLDEVCRTERVHDLAQ